MFIPKYRKRQILIGCIIVVIFISIAILVNMIYYRFRYQNHSVEKMDKMEQYFDSESPLIMINTKENLIGFYMGSTPILHYSYEEDPDDGLYKTRYDDVSEYFEIAKGNGVVVGFIETYGNVEIQRNFDDCIVLIYSKNFY